MADPSENATELRTLTLRLPKSVIRRTLAAMSAAGHDTLEEAVAEVLDIYCGMHEVVHGSDGVPVGLLRHNENGDVIGVW